jgi:hypothetical protein
MREQSGRTHVTIPLSRIRGLSLLPSISLIMIEHGRRASQQWLFALCHAPGEGESPMNTARLLLRF